MDELLPCPFCGVEIEGRNGGIFHPELPDESDCPLAGLSWSADYYGKLWNARPTQPSGVTEASGEVAWLVECPKYHPGKYFALCDCGWAKCGRHWWTDDVHRATKFPTKEAAEAARGNDENCVAIEHLFGCTMRSAAPTSGEVERLLEALDWAEDHDPQLVGKIRERAALATASPDERLIEIVEQVRDALDDAYHGSRDVDDLRATILAQKFVLNTALNPRKGEHD